jgi:hypothetical protein
MTEGVIPVEILFSPTEFHAAVNSALLQVTCSSLDKRNHAYTMKRNKLGILNHSIIGALGEIAFAKFADRFFIPQVNTFHNIPDCFEDIEIRTSDKNTTLITRDDDAPERKYVKVMTNGNKALIVGWLYGHETRRREFFRQSEGQRDCWMTPHQFLRPPKTIFNIEHQKEIDW